MAFTRSGVRLPLAPPTFAKASSQILTAKDAKVARRSPQGEDGLIDPMKYVYLLESISFLTRHTSAWPTICVDVSRRTTRDKPPTRVNSNHGDL
jgi:hypothetical protein